MESDIRKQYIIKWTKYLTRYLSYKQPYFINGAQFQNLDDDLSFPDYTEDDLNLENDDIAAESSIKKF